MFQRVNPNDNMKMSFRHIFTLIASRFHLDHDFLRTILPQYDLNVLVLFFKCIFNKKKPQIINTKKCIDVFI
jgi:hypothetical protein